MNRITHVRQMANYNEWMNTQLYQAAAQLPTSVLNADQRVFFGSIIGTFNHIMVGDLIWLHRFSNHPARFSQLADLSAFPNSQNLKQMISNDITELTALRSDLDRLISTWTTEITENDLDASVSYITLQAEPVQKNFFALLMHFFNHQTHHRGQISALLSQHGIDYGATDLVTLIPNDFSL